MDVSDLVGKKIEWGASESRIARIKTFERKPVQSGSSQVTMSADGNYKLVVTISVDDEKSGFSSKTWSATGRLGQPTPFRDGTVILLWENESLVFLRTMGEGGIKAEMKFSRNENGLTCQLTRGYTEEVGVGKTTSMATTTGNAVEILSTK